MTRVGTPSRTLWQGVGIILAIAIAFGAGYLLRPSNSAELDAAAKAMADQAAATKAQVATLEEEIESLDTKLAALQQNESQVAQLQGQVATLSKQLADARGGSTAQLSTLADGLATDRLLLVELRKDPPQDRTEARAYWTRVKDLAVKSNTTLGPWAEKVINAMPAYFTWRERRYASADEQAITYVLTGAAGYDIATKEFWNNFLKVAIDRIDAAVLNAP